MRRKKIFFALVFCVAFLGIYIVRLFLNEHGRDASSVQGNLHIMGMPIVYELDFLKDKEKEMAEKNPGVYFEGMLLPYSTESNTLYLSQTVKDGGWVGEFSVRQGAYLCIPEDEYWYKKSEAIEEGHAYTLLMVTENEYYELSLVVSGMPIIEITTSGMEVQEKVAYEENPDKLVYDSEDLYYGSIRVFDSGVNSDRYEITECNVKYHLKGATSASFEKKGYSLSLQDVRGEKLNVSLLGMRYDNSWKLNAMVMDNNRIREMTACQIWEALDAANEGVNEAGPRMEYVELIMDNDYKGLYCLVEPVDEKKLGLDSNDALYKVINWDIPEISAIQTTIDNKWSIVYPVRVRYPQNINDYTSVWSPIRDYIDKVYYMGEGAKNIAEIVYLDNAYDMSMFLMVVNGSDNFWKNMYYVADVKENGSYTMRQIPWDLDLTFGNVYDYNSENYFKFNPDVTTVYQEASFNLLRQYAPESLRTGLVERWEEYRQDFLSTEYLHGIMSSNVNYLKNSGVEARENNRWPQYAMSSDIEYLLEYQADRMEWLDEYFGGLAE